MSGGMSLVRPIPIPTIRAEGARLGYEGELLEDFTTILTIVDDIYVEVEVRKAAAEARKLANAAKQKQTRR